MEIRISQHGSVVTVDRIAQDNDAAVAAASCTDVPVVGADGHRARVVSVRQAGPEPIVLIRIEHGPEVVLPLRLFSVQPDGSWRLQLALRVSSGRAS